MTATAWLVALIATALLVTGATWYRLTSRTQREKVLIVPIGVYAVIVAAYLSFLRFAPEARLMTVETMIVVRGTATYYILAGAEMLIVYLLLILACATRRMRPTGDSEIESV